MASTWRKYPILDCAHCDGCGRTYENDDDGKPYQLRCEFCEGSGQTTSCNRCGEVVGLPEAESRSGYCVSCVIELETTDWECERERIRRAS